MTNEAYSVTFKNIDGFDMVRVVDSNTNKLHPYPAKIYVEGSLYFTVPRAMVGPLKMASPTIMIDELNFRKNQERFVYSLNQVLNRN